MMFKYRFQRLFKIVPKGMVFVTAADSTHYKSVLQLIRSIRKYEPKSTVVFYDLGLTDEQISEIEHILETQGEYCRFEYEKYPSYFNIKINAGEYAWKPAMIYETFNRYQTRVCWMDAGDMLIEPLYRIRELLDKYGFYSPKSAGSVQEWSHPLTLQYFDIKDDAGFLRKNNLNGAFIAVDYANEKIRNMVHAWYNCALDKSCIAPEGSNRSNHRQDQTVLTLLAYLDGVADRIPKKLYGFKIHMDID